jgi:hypothetical protein
MHCTHDVRYDMRCKINRRKKLRMQCGDGRGACYQPHQGADNGNAFRQDIGRFCGSMDNRGQEIGGEGMIETLGRQTDRALLAVGMVLDIHLVQHQAELTNDQRNDEQQPAEAVSPVSVCCKSVDHDPEGYTPSCVNSNRFPVPVKQCRDPRLSRAGGHIPMWLNAVAARNRRENRKPD